MNPHLPPPAAAPPFSFFPLDPPQNPNPNFFPSHIHHLQHPFSASTSCAPPQPPPSDLASALSTLKQLIHLSETTLASLPTTTATSTPTPSASATCPFNRHHRLPPLSLFRHSLHCPSFAAPLHSSLFQSLRYPHTLQSSRELLKQQNQSHFLQTLHDPDSELCFSLDSYNNNELTSNFFYRDCPGVVSSTELYGTGNPNHMLALPGVLSAECANFVATADVAIKGFSIDCVSILPSELWLIRRDIEAWNDFPTLYSCSILRAILCCDVNNLSDLKIWLILNSPSYGVVIDEPMTDHIVLLFRLCLKVIIRETFNLVNLMFAGEMELGLSNCAKCPKLVQVLRWLASQLSILYGQVNGKMLAINMLKHWIVKSALNSSLFGVTEKTSEIPVLKDDIGKSEESFEETNESARNYTESESIDCSVIFVSQVAAGVAALHERSLLEEQIKALRDSQPPTAYQRMTEHAYISKRADDERLKRSNYRPVLEHDGILGQWSRNQETNKFKTREELLAEERDYKRRRMSYRGKKMKRTTTQVMRDIIEEYMEEIKQAGGIGCLVKGVEETRKLASEPFSIHSSADADELKKSRLVSIEVSRGQPHGYRRHLHSDSSIGSPNYGDKYSEDDKQQGNGSYWNNVHREEDRSIYGDRHDKEYYGRSLDGKRSSSRPQEQTSSRRQQDDAKTSRRHLPRSPDRNHNWSNERNSRRRERADHNSEVKDRQKNRYQRSESMVHHEFEDRYNPSESHDMPEDDAYCISK